jgi:hypothetical protein
MLAHHARREAEPLGGGRKAACFNDFREDPHAFEAVHVHISFLTCREKSIDLNADYQTCKNN